MANNATVGPVRGTLPNIIRNDDGLYEGDLILYFQRVFNTAENLTNPYHNFRHLMHVVWLCYQACIFYKGKLTPRQMRNLLIAAMFHDFDHNGKREPDINQIRRAVEGFCRHILPEDLRHAGDIISLIVLTEYPYQTPSSEICVEAQILRDADLSQAMSVAWIQQIVFGLSSEWETKPLDVLGQQEKFLSSLQFSSEWARQMFNSDTIRAKIDESRELLALLTCVGGAA